MEPSHQEVVVTGAGLSPLLIDQGGGEEEDQVEAQGIQLATTTSSDDDGYAVVVDEDRNASGVRVAAGVALANSLDWYEFAACGFLSSNIGKAFLGTERYGRLAFVLLFGRGLWFWLVFLPLGAVLARRGDLYYNDQREQRRVLRLCVLIMGAASFATGSIPACQRIGFAALILLKVTRMIRGTAAVVQLASSIVYWLENGNDDGPGRRRGLRGSFVPATAYLGNLLGLLVGVALMEILNNRQLDAWGWRLPFWLEGILAGLSAFWLRSHRRGDHQDDARPTNEENPANDNNNNNNNPLRVAFARKNWRSLAAAAMVGALVGGGYRMVFYFIPSYVSEVSGIETFGIYSLAVEVSFVFIMLPLSGYLSDRFGRRLVMTIGGVCTAVISPCLVLLAGRGIPALSFVALSLVGIFLAFWIAPVPAWLVSSFEPTARLTSVALGYSVFLATYEIFSRLLTMVLRHKVGVTGPIWIIPGLAVISLGGLWWVAPQKVGSSIQPIGS